MLARQAGGRFGKTRWAELVRRGAARIYVSRADVNHGVTELVEDLLQGYVRRRLPEAAGVTSANGDGAFGTAAGSGRRTRVFVVIVNIVRAEWVLREQLLVVPRVSFAATREGPTLGDTLALFRAGDPTRLCAALTRACALAAGDPLGPADLACMLERPSLGHFAARVVYWASFVVDCVWIRIYGSSAAVGGRATAFVLVSDFGPTGGAAAAFAHTRVCRPKKNPPRSRLHKKYVRASAVPFGGIARVVEGFEEIDDEALITEVIADEVAAQPRGLVAAPPLAVVARVAASAVATFAASADASFALLATPVRRRLRDVARDVAERLDIRTDDARDVAAQMHAGGQGVTPDSLATLVQRLRFED